MKVNWKVRFRNKPWLACFFAAILTFIYTILGLFDIYPEVTKNDVGEIISSCLMFLSLIGVINDPTTDGLGDSQRALSYEIPWADPELVTEEEPVVYDLVEPGEEEEETEEGPNEAEESEEE